MGLADVRPYFKTWETKAIDDEKKQTEGLISTDQIDRDRDKVNQESLWDRMDGFIESGVMLFMHGALAPVGVPIGWEKWRGKVDGKTVNGTLLRAEVRTDHDIIVQTGLGAIIYDAKNVWALIKQKLSRSHSIGFMASGKALGDETTELSVTDLFEVSYVTLPANPGAMMEVAKMLGSAVLQAPTLEETVAINKQEEGPTDWTEAQVGLALALAHARVRMIG